MILAQTTVVDKTDRVKRATDKAGFKNFSHAAAGIRKTAQASIQKSDDPSAPGEPPHTRGQRGHNLKTAIVFDATKEDAEIGPRFSVVGTAGAAHEFGKVFRGTDYPERSFMEPALTENLGRFAREWQGSIGD